MFVDITTPKHLLSYRLPVHRGHDGTDYILIEPESEIIDHIVVGDILKANIFYETVNERNIQREMQIVDIAFCKNKYKGYFKTIVTFFKNSN